MVRTVLVQTYHPYTQFTHVHPLGIMMIAAAAREAGHADMHILDMKVEGWTPQQACEAIERLRPDVVGLSAMTYEAGCMHEVARELKRRRARKFGGVIAQRTQPAARWPRRNLGKIASAQERRATQATQSCGQAQPFEGRQSRRQNRTGRPVRQIVRIEPEQLLAFTAHGLAHPIATPCIDPTKP